MIGNRIYKFDTLKSTNDYVKEKYNSLNHGDVVVAGNQTAGKGRRGNIWLSETGNIYFSFILKDNVNEYNDIFKILMKVSISVVDLLSEFDIKTTIKYPNDIIFEDKKIAGILIETIGGEKPHCLIVGIGININQTEFKKLKSRAISLFMIKNKTHELSKVLKKFIEIFNIKIDDNLVYSKYLENSYVINKSVILHDTKYKITNINMKGEIELEKNGKKIVFNSQDITLDQLYN